MADINVERKGGMGWLWWVLGLILVGLILWGVFAAGDDEAEVVVEEQVAAPVATPEPSVEPAAATAPGIAEVLANPSAYFGQPFSTGTVRVAEVASDRAFWVEGDAGQRLLVVKNESPREGVADVQGRADVRSSRDVNAGEQLQINGTLHDAGNLDAVQPPLDAQTRQHLQEQRIFLQANVEDIQHVR